MRDLTEAQLNKVLETLRPVSESDLEERYKDMLNDCYGTVKVAGYEYDTAEALEQLDPVAYRCGFSDYISAELDGTLYEINGEYFEQYEVDQVIEEMEEEEE